MLIGRCPSNGMKTGATQGQPSRPSLCCQQTIRHSEFWHSHSEYLPAVRHLLVSSGSVGLELIGAHICLIQISMTWSHKVELTPSLLFIFKHSSRHLLKCEVHNYNLPRSVIHWHLAFPLSVRLYQHHQHSRNTAKYFISNICSLHLP